MATVCPNCHSPVADGVRFCTECGCQIPAAPTIQTDNVDQSAGASAPAATSAVSAETGTLTFIGLRVLFAIPLVGWIAAIICSFTGENRIVKNYSRADLILKVVKTVLAILIGVLLSSAVQQIVSGLEHNGRGVVSGFIDEMGENMELPADSIGLSDEEYDEALKIFDADGDGMLTVDEILSSIGKISNQ